MKVNCARAVALICAFPLALAGAGCSLDDEAKGAGRPDGGDGPDAGRTGLQGCTDVPNPTRKLTITGPARVEARPGETVSFAVIIVEPGSDTGFVSGAEVDFSILRGGDDVTFLSPQTATTDADGVAEVLLDVGMEPGSFRVRMATEGACSLFGTVDVERQIKQLLVIGSPSRVAFVRERLPLQVRVIDGDGAPLQAEPIEFEIRGTNEGGASLEPPTGQTALDGSLSANFFTGTQATTFAVRAIHAEAGVVDFQVRVNPAADGAPCESNFDCAPGYFCEEGICNQNPLDVPDGGGNGGGNGGVLLECPRDEESPCILDAECEAGMFCDGGECNPRPEGGCATRNDCAKGYSCTNGACIPDFIGGTGGDDRSCRVNRDCGNGLLCFDGTCLPEGGCSNNSQCPAGNVCQAPNCVPENDCIFDDACGDGQFCDGAACRAIPPDTENSRPIDVSGRWRTEHTFDMTDSLLGIGNIGDILDTINQILQGNIAQLLGLPSFIAGPVNRAFQRIIDRYVPPWLVGTISALNNVANLFSIIRTKGTMDMQYVNNCDRLTGTEEWDTIIVMWIEQCELGRRDPAWPDCAAMSLDTQRGDIRVETRELEPFQAVVSGNTLSISTRKFEVEFFRVIEWAVNTVIQIATGYEDVEELIEEIIDCGAIHDALNDSVGDFLCDGPLAYCDELPFEDFCETFKGPLAMQIAEAIRNIGIEATLMEFSGYATIVDDGRQPQPRARELVNGVWDGRSRVIFNGDIEGTWRARR